MKFPFFFPDVITTIDCCDCDFNFPCDNVDNNAKSSPSSPLLVLSTSSNKVDLPKWILRNDNWDTKMLSKFLTLRWNLPLMGRCCLLALLWSSTKVIAPLVPSVLLLSVLESSGCAFEIQLKHFDPGGVVSDSTMLWCWCWLCERSSHQFACPLNGPFWLRRRCQLQM